MKYKILTKEQIIISLDRLTRFKNTREKYFRVFSDVLVSCLIEPKLKKNDIEKMDFALIAEYVSEIFNVSINEYINIKNSDVNKSLEQNKYVQEILRDYENSVFVNDKDTQKLLNNEINYLEAIDLIPEDCPVNLKWLTAIVRSYTAKQSGLQTNVTLTDCHASKEARNDIKEMRADYLLKYPIEEVILVEGITEDILLPVFAQKLGYDFYAEGIQVIAAGGKNQVVKMYYKLANELKLPIFVLLDKDAEDNINQIKPKLRSGDRIHLVSCGEFEDLLPKSLIIKAVNSHFKNFLSISESDLSSEISTVKILEDIFKTKGLHEFKKAEFAKIVRESISLDSDISTEIKAIIDEIRLTNKMLDSEICS